MTIDQRAEKIIEDWWLDHLWEDPKLAEKDLVDRLRKGGVLKGEENA